MKYLLLVYCEQGKWETVAQDDRDKLWDDCVAYGQEITASGHLLAGSPLQPASTATTLRLEDGKTVITDGPFAETKEVLAGYHLVECRNLDEAIALGRRFPGLRYGMAIEVRAVMED